MDFQLRQLTGHYHPHLFAFILTCSCGVSSGTERVGRKVIEYQALLGCCVVGVIFIREGSFLLMC